MSWRSQYKQSMQIGKLRRENADLKKAFDLAVNQAIKNCNKPVSQQTLYDTYLKLSASRLAAQQQLVPPLSRILGFPLFESI